MSNVILTSGGVGQAIVAGTADTNGPAFPIKYFLLAYDPAIDPDIHGEGVTSATPFSGTVSQGDTSLIQSGGHLIFKKTDYVISQEDFLILNDGASTFATDTIGGSDKDNANKVVFLDGNPLLDVISGGDGAGSLDLYTESLGTWHCTNGVADFIAGDTTQNSLTATSANFFPIESYSPITTSAGSPENILRGLFKCRVSQAYGNFKFNKIGIYMDSGVGNPPVLLAVACLDTAITKNKEGTSITNLEFDVEIEFHTEGTFSNVVYMTGDYWYAVPDGTGYGLYTDRDVMIGASGTGSWNPLAKLDITTLGAKPAICLNKNHGVEYFFLDVVSNGSSSQYTSGATVKLYTSMPNDFLVYPKYQTSFNYYDDGQSTVYPGDTADHKSGIRTQYESYTNGNIKNTKGFESILDTIRNSEQTNGFYSLIKEHRYLGGTPQSIGYRSEILRTTIADATNQYGFYSRIVGRGLKQYGFYTEVLPDNSKSSPDSIGLYAGVGTLSSICTTIGSQLSASSSYSAFGIRLYVNTSGASSNDAHGNYLNLFGRGGDSTNTYFGSYKLIRGELGSMWGSYEIVSGGLNATNVYGKSIKLYGSASTMYGVYSEIIENGNFFSKNYAGYFKCPNINPISYAISADGRTYLNGTLVVEDSAYFSTAYLTQDLFVDGNVNISGDSNIDGFTKFGDNSIGLKCVVIDGVDVGPAAGIGMTEDLSSYITDGDEIVSWEVLISWSGTNNWVKENSPTTAIKFTTLILGAGLIIDLDSGASSLANQPYRIVLWYKEA